MLPLELRQLVDLVLIAARMACLSRNNNSDENKEDGKHGVDELLHKPIRELLRHAKEEQRGPGYGGEEPGPSRREVSVAF